MAVCDIGVAVDGRKKDDPPNFFDCTAFGKTAEIIGQYFTKGKPICIQGSLRQERWEKDGKKHSKVKVVIDSFSFVPGDSSQSFPDSGDSPPKIRTADPSDPIPKYDEDEPPF